MTAPELIDVDPLLAALRDPAVVARFWGKVDRRDPAECWEWTASGRAAGYGQFYLQGRHRYAHRVAYALERGPIPEGRVVRHTCDNPPCVNPAHLELGTQRDNVRDMAKRGRAVYLTGEDNSAAVLTEVQVAEARRRARAGETITAVAENIPIHFQTLRDAIRGDTWPGDILGEPPVPATSPRKATA